jgi:hypothetical protein
MAPIRAFFTLLLVMLFACICCTNSNQTSNENKSPSPSGSDDPSACRGNCEGVAYIKIKNSGDSAPADLRLHPVEEDSLKNTMKATRVTGPVDRVHLHVDATNGELVFTREGNQDPTHVTGTEPTISLSNQKLATPSLPVRVVATPGAMKLLQERSKQP